MRREFRFHEVFRGMGRDGTPPRLPACCDEMSHGSYNRRRSRRCGLSNALRLGIAIVSFASGAIARRSALRSRAALGPEVADGRAVPRRPRARGRRSSRAAEPLLLRRGRAAASGKRDNAGRTWEPIFDCAADRLDRRDRRRAVGPRRALRRLGRGRHALGHLVRQRHVQVGRRRQDLDARRPRRTRARSGGSSSIPRDSEPRLRRRARPRLRPEPRARRLPLDGRRDRPGPRSSSRTRTPARSTSPFDPCDTQDDLRRALADAPSAVERLPAIERSRAAASTARRTAATRGRRSTGRVSVREARAHRHRVRAERPAPRLRARRREGGRPLRLATTAASSWKRASARPAHLGARLVLRRRDGRSEGRRTSSTPATPRCTARPTAARRSSRSRARRAATTTTRSGSIPTDPRRMIVAQRSGRGRHRRRRNDVELLVQPADRAVLPRRDRRPVPLLDLRRAAGQRRRGDAVAHRLLARSRCATGGRSRPAARTATSRPIPTDPDIVFGGDGRAVRLDARCRSRTSTRRSPIPGDYRGEWTLPLAFSPRDPKALYFGNQFVFRTTDGGQHWEKISPDLTRENPGVPADARSRRPPQTAPTCTDRAAASSTRSRPSPLARRPALVRHRRRPHLADARRRRALGERHAAGADGLVEGRRSSRPRTSMRTRPTRRSTATASTISPRTSTGRATAGKTLDADRARDSRRAASSTSCARTRSGAGLLYAGTETGVFVSFDDGDHWQPLAAQPAQLLDPRHRGPPRRPRRRHARPLLLGARRSVAAAPARRERPPPRTPGSSRRAPAVRLHPAALPGHARAEGRARGREPAARRGPRLLPEDGGGGAGRPRDPGRAGRDRPALRERRQERRRRTCSGSRSPRTGCRAARAAPGVGGNASLRLGPALCGPAGALARPARRPVRRRGRRRDATRFASRRGERR